MTILGTDNGSALGAGNGQHRQTSASSNGSAPQITNQSTGGTEEDNPYTNFTLTSAIGSYYLTCGTTVGTLSSRIITVGGGYGSSGGVSRFSISRGISNPPHDPTKLKPEKMIAGEIIAWRAWRIHNDTLMSVVADGKEWSATEPMAGDAAAGYGVHAYKGPHGPVLDSYVTAGSSELWVIGEVALWGDIIEHEDGYRAEFARVHSLVTWHDRVPEFQRKAIRDKYLTTQPFKIEDAA